MDNRRRKQRVRGLNRRWISGLTVSVLCVVIAIVGIALVQAGTMSQWWAYGFLVLGLIGAATAMLQTMMRNKAGDDIDEAKL
jgi:hypothetical protein